MTAYTAELHANVTLLSKHLMIKLCSHLLKSVNCFIDNKNIELCLLSKTFFKLLNIV